MPVPFSAIGPAAPSPPSASTRPFQAPRVGRGGQGPRPSLPSHPSPRSVTGGVGQAAAQGVDRVRLAQARLDRILSLAESGRTFTPAELLALQGQVYQASQEIDLASRIVEKGAGGVKQLLQTQV